MMKQKSTWLILLIVAGSIAVILALLFVPSSSSNQSVSSIAAEEDQVEAFIENFGEELSKVSLLSPEAEKNLHDAYGPYVSESLVSEWVKNPQEALGRTTSSPWPAGIEVESVKKLENKKGAYLVVGEIIFMTSTQETRTQDDNAGTRKVFLTVERQPGVTDEEIFSYEETDLVDIWMVTSFETVGSQRGIESDLATSSRNEMPVEPGFDDDITLAERCEDSGGNWLREFHECEYVKESWCERENGTFHACTSACRHNPNAEACTMQCVPVCEFR